jgi:hypothetical protein
MSSKSPQSSKRSAAAKRGAHKAGTSAETTAETTIAAPMPGVDTKLALTEDMRAEAERIIRTQKRFCRGPLSPQHAKAVEQLLREGRRDEASAMDAAGRSHCGADFNDVVVSGPWDGQPHTYACPRCGVAGKYVAPSFAPRE